MFPGEVGFMKKKINDLWCIRLLIGLRNLNQDTAETSTSTYFGGKPCEPC